jgi:hypothetical protein
VICDAEVGSVLFLNVCPETFSSFISAYDSQDDEGRSLNNVFVAFILQLWLTNSPFELHLVVPATSRIGCGYSDIRKDFLDSILYESRQDEIRPIYP